MYSVRVLQPEDYDQLQRWWKFWRFPAPAQDCLPNNGTGGLMIIKDGVDVCAGFLYFTNSKMCWLEYIVSNPEIKENRAEAIQELIYELCSLAQRMGYKIVFTSVKNQNLINHYTQCGFLKGSNNTTEMVFLL